MMMHIKARPHAFRPRCWLSALYLLLSLGTSAWTAPAPEKTPAGEKMALLRWWSVLEGGGKPASQGYTLTGQTASDENPRILFSGETGCVRSAFGSRYAEFSPGRYRFDLSVGAEALRSLKSLNQELKAGHAYTLHVLHNRGKVSMDIFEEYPEDPEDSSEWETVAIFNGMAEPPIYLRGVESADRLIPWSDKPMILSKASLQNRPISLVWKTPRGSEVSWDLDYRNANGRLTAVFMRNHYNQPTLAVLSGTPDLSAETSE